MLRLNKILAKGLYFPLLINILRALERLSNPEKIKSEIVSIIAQREELLKVLVDVKFVEKI